MSPTKSNVHLAAEELFRRGLAAYCVPNTVTADYALLVMKNIPVEFSGDKNLLETHIANMFHTYTFEDNVPVEAIVATVLAHLRLTE